MSSFATAPSQDADQETTSGQELHLSVNPDVEPAADQAVAEMPPFEAPIGNSPTIDEVSLVERLLSQVEARSMALVPYRYGSLPATSAAKSNTALLAGILVAIWLSTLTLAVAYIRYVGRSPFGRERSTATAPLVIGPESDLQEQKVAASVDHLAKALASSLERIDQLQAAVERSNRSVQKIAIKVDEDRTAALSTRSNDEGTPVSAATAISEPNPPKDWHRVLDIKPTDAAVPHNGADGAIDYWLVPRGADPSPSKVLPIGTSADGVVVHNLEDGKDYTLTPSGEWRNGALTPAGN